MLKWLRNIFAERDRKSVRAKFDAAQTSDENRKHWGQADGLSADAATQPFVRATLRNRARYEYENNSYAKGIGQTIANYVIGTGPRLQVMTDDPAANRLIEREWSRWAGAVHLAQKMRTARIAMFASGEAFAQKITANHKGIPVQLDITLIEADRVAAPYGAAVSASDGIEYNAAGYPTSYNVLKYHPGDVLLGGAMTSAADTVEAANMLHLFRAERPGQSRGIPELTPALPLFAQLRRYTLAVLNSAEQAAAIGGVIQTDTVADDSSSPEPMDVINVERGRWIVLPDGYKLGQVKAEQPTTMYGDFKRQIINEIARALNVPYNIAAGDSSSYNYASGRLDGQGFIKFIGIDQFLFEDAWLIDLLATWFDEAKKIHGYLPPSVATLEYLPHDWLWDGLDHVDPVKEATAQQIRLASGVSNLAIECGDCGRDWEPVAQQRARERKLYESLGLPYPGDAVPTQPPPDPNTQDANADGTGGNNG